ncbi:hypothetical protein C9374_000054 [Naegleria lovaniensis]|uniref:Uncharacterized protein n=1 Tax=Naegleria lovaniensis TaxID=51637 RepID=A0AA88KM66_NAELO|nr:uncharacterized protein C9374_000054 [Naegleria lovaniensis]KAG2388615.1 hypothetical protein C9374_000054 [Naegleria lovaniensis]
MISAEDSERYRMDMNNYNDYNNLKIQRGGSVVGQQSSFPSDRSTTSSSPLSHHSSDQQYRENYPQFSSQPQKPPFMMPMQQPQPQQQPFGNGRSGGGLNQPQPQPQQQQTPPPFSSGSHPMHQSQNQSQPYMHDSYYSNHPMMNNTTPSANHHWNGTSSAHWDHPQSSYTYQDQTSSPPEQYQSQQQQPPPQKVGGLFRSGGSGGSLNASPGTSFSSAQPMYSSSAQATQLPQTTTTTTTNMNSWMGQQQQGTSVAGQQATPQMPPPTQPPSFQPPMMQGNSPQNGMLKNQPKPFSSQPSQQFPSMTGQNGGTPVALPPFEPMVQGNAMVQPQLQQESKGLVGSHAFNNLSIPTSQPSLLGGEQKLEELAAAYEKEIEQLKNYNAELRNMVDSEKNLIEKFKTIVEKVEQSNQYGSVMQSQMSQSSYPLENSFIQQGYPNINQGYSRYEQQQQPQQHYNNSQSYDQQQQIIYNQGNNYSSQGYQK